MATQLPTVDDIDQDIRAAEYEQVQLEQQRETLTGKLAEGFTKTAETEYTAITARLAGMGERIKRLRESRADAARRAIHERFQAWAAQQTINEQQQAELEADARAKYAAYHAAAEKLAAFSSEYQTHSGRLHRIIEDGVALGIPRGAILRLDAERQKQAQAAVEAAQETTAQDAP